MKNTKIISAFPGCGKTYCYNKYKDSDIKILDSDSSEFSWIKDENGMNTKERNPDFPMNYIKHIKGNIGEVDIIFVSSHKVVRDALKDNNINYILIYPIMGSKGQYLSRYKRRGSDKNFIKFISDNWSNFIKEMRKENFPDKVVIGGFTSLDDVIINGYCINDIYVRAENKEYLMADCKECGLIEYGMCKYDSKKNYIKRLIQYNEINLLFDNEEV